jgi:xylulokinase
MFADVFGKRVGVLENQEGSAYGAALLAMVGTGEYSSVPEACQAAIREVRSLEPRAVEHRLYAEGHRIYQSLYPAIKGAISHPDSQR